ncbi:MAG TPA: anhydro-N-acetylmuramic acid kinase [Woeseiaceae bacterium]|nr:anhydro-N-acetylmuramic acid kinase [Woeseiaceae bacterium]
MKPADRLFLGLMSGTSMDGIDAAIVRFGDRHCEVLAADCFAYPDVLRQSLIKVRQDPSSCALDSLGQLDRQAGECFAEAAMGLLAKNRIAAADVVAIGSHGQTLRHQPLADPPFTLQIGDPGVIAARTGIPVVADFRRGDMAVGGQGAPLAPAFHQWLFWDAGKDRVVLNIGGIANVTILPARGPVTGFDTGPGNTLLDAWVRRHQYRDFDPEGSWASQGLVSGELLSALMRDPYFAAAPPKSTGFEYFNVQWLDSRIAACKVRQADQDVQATLAELTVQSIADAIIRHAPGTTQVFVCGGGFHNRDLMQRLGARLKGITFQSTSAQGLDPDWVEAAAFAWLAMRRIAGEPGNLPSVTGASRPVLLGGIYVA